MSWKKSGDDLQGNSYKADPVKGSENTNNIQNEIPPMPRVNLDKEFDQLYEKMTQVSSLETEQNVTEIKGYERVETNECFEVMEKCTKNSNNSFQKSTEEIALEKDVEDAVRIQMSREQTSHISKSNMTDAEKFKTQIPTNKDSSIRQTNIAENGANGINPLPPLDDPSIILTSPSHIRRTSEQFQGIIFQRDFFFHLKHIMLNDFVDF